MNVERMESHSGKSRLAVSSLMFVDEMQWSSGSTWFKHSLFKKDTCVIMEAAKNVFFLKLAKIE